MELNYKEFGQGPPLIILHGLFGTLDNWQTIGKKLAEHYTVYLIDQRNHGRSPHAEPFDYPTLAADLHDFMESNWLFKAHLLGHSMGGKTAMQFALEYPDMVDKLIVVDIAPVKYPPRHQAIFEALFSLDLDALKDRQEADAALKVRIPEQSVRQFLLKNLMRKKEGGYRFKMNLPVIYKNYAHILDEIRAEAPFEGDTLFIKGGKSEHILPEHEPKIKALFPRYTLKTVENAGHWVHADAPETLLTLVSDFLKT
ncbi:MAG: alpha/beta fold hydrolase [Bacteroidetes bacterium]|nr:MAG: alpha/beta fold hydrolase [Bacteroidota bacterium]